MTMRKYQKVEKTELATPEQHSAISDAMRKIGKESMADLDNNERESVQSDLDRLDDDGCP